jgi:multidrug efflux pump subunit AcrA (membrane-fusion protein)
MSRKYSNYLKAFRKFTSKFYGLITKQIDKKPLLSFFTLLGLLFFVILISSLLQKPKPTKNAVILVKKVEVYRVGKVPKITLQAQVEKSGVVTITSQTSGIVSNIYTTEGKTVKKGAWIISLSSNSQGGNSLSVSRQIAEKQNKNIEDSYQTQKDLISRQRDLSNETQNNSDKLRDITSQSIGDTQNLINLNSDIINTLNGNIATLQSTDSSTSSSLVLSSKQILSQFQSANLQLNNQLRSAQYQQENDNPPKQLAEIQKDISSKQLDIQDKALDLNREVSKLQLQIARINEGLMYPSAPFTSTVEKIFVRVGQYINSGTPIAVLSQTTNIDPKFTATAYVSKEIVDYISKLEPSIVTIGNKSLELSPSYISREATQNNLYSVIFDLPQEDYGDVVDKGYITVQIPIGYADTTSVASYLPIDSIYQSQNGSYIFLFENGKAVSREVVLGEVFGRFVRVTSGLKSGDTIILDRNIVAGDKVEAK